MRAGSARGSPRTVPRPGRRSYRAGTSPVDAAKSTLSQHSVQRLLDLSVLDRLVQGRLDRLGVGLRVEQPADPLDHVPVQVVGLLLDRGPQAHTDEATR